MITEYYKPCAHVRVTPDGRFVAVRGTRNIYFGLTDKQRELEKIREEAWRYAFEQACDTGNPEWWRIWRLVNEWDPAGLL